MNENDTKLANLWRQWYDEDGDPAWYSSEEGAHCFFCYGSLIFSPDDKFVVKHSPDCIYVRVKAIIDRENQ